MNHEVNKKNILIISFDFWVRYGNDTSKYTCREEFYFLHMLGMNKLTNFV